jgi:hypothetical protein
MIPVTKMPLITGASGAFPPLSKPFIRKYFQCKSLVSGTSGRKHILIRKTGYFYLVSANLPAGDFRMSAKGLNIAGNNEKNLMTIPMKRDENTTLDLVPLSEAEACIAAYKQTLYDQKISHENILKAYLLRTRDLFEAFGLDKSAVFELSHPYVRIYIGLEKGTFANNYRLFLVPVTLDGNDDIPFGYINDGDAFPQSYVYDFNTPCPKTCDRNSRLYQAGSVLE